MAEASFDIFNWINLAALVFSVLAMLVAFGFVLQKRRDRLEKADNISPIITLFLGQQFASLTLLCFLVFGDPAWMQISIFELSIFLIICHAGSLAIVAALNHERSIVSFVTVGIVGIAVCFTASVLLQASAYPSNLLNVDFAALFAGGIGLCLAGGGLTFLALRPKSSSFISVLSCGAIIVLILATGGLVNTFIGFRPIDGLLRGLTDTGLDFVRLECLLVLSVVSSFSLAFVIGSNPREHWRRYLLTVVLVGTMAVMVYVSTGRAMEEANRYVDLSRLIERVERVEVELEHNAADYTATRMQSTKSQALPSEVFRNLEQLGVAIEGIEAHLKQLPRNSEIARQFFYESEDGTPALRDVLNTRVQQFKQQFGLPYFSESGAEFLHNHALFESQINDLAAMVLERAVKTNSQQKMVQDMSLAGGLFLVLFMSFGVFWPAQTSTRNALNELEAEQKRVEKLAICAEHTTKGVVLVDKKGLVTWCNQAFLDMSGFELKELIGYTLTKKLHHGGGDKKVLQSIFSSLGAGKNCEFEILASRKSGEEFWMKGEITPISKNGELHQFVHVLEDVSEARKLQEHLEQARLESERLALIARHANDGMAILDSSMKVAWINPAMEKMTGFTVEEFRASSMHERLSGPLTSQKAMRRILNEIERRKAVTVEALLYPKRGEPYWLEASHTPVFDGDGRLSGYIIVHRDITERKNLEFEIIASRDELALRVEERTQTIKNQALELEKSLDKERELNAMQAEFVSMASHEFRTPLTIIDGLARRIDKHADKFTPEQTREKVQNIRSAVKRMTMLVERTLDASRLSSGRIRLTPESFDARQVLSEVIARQRDVASGYDISADLSGLPDTLYGDGRLLDNVFTNVISNAVKYAGESRKVEITTSTGTEYVEIRVKDYGIGIPKEELPKIFQRFFRASTSTGIPGTGIGLNLVKSLVEMHYGLVEIASEVGEWTEFTMKLPLESPLLAMTPKSQETDDDTIKGDDRAA